MIAEPSAAVYADFGISTTLRKKDGSATQETSGLYDEAATEYTTDRASVRSRQPQITVAASHGVLFIEGDFADFGGKTYEILDNLSDNEVTVLTLSEYSS